MNETLTEKRMKKTIPMKINNVNEKEVLELISRFNVDSEHFGGPIGKLTAFMHEVLEANEKAQIVILLYLKKEATA